MKPPRDFTLGEIQTILETEHNGGVFPDAVKFTSMSVGHLLEYLADREKRIKAYQVQKVAEMIKAGKTPIEKPVASLDADLQRQCVLVLD